LRGGVFTDGDERAQVFAEDDFEAACVHGDGELWGSVDWSESIVGRTEVDNH
jgi:hypothetical protein